MAPIAAAKATTPTASSAPPASEGGEWLLLSPHRKQLPAKLFSEPFQLPQTDGRGIPRDTLRRALGLLAEAGWKPSDAGLLNSAGQPLRFEILLVNPRLERILQPYVENLARIGIEPTCAPLTARSTSSDWTTTITT